MTGAVCGFVNVALQARARVKVLFAAPDLRIRLTQFAGNLRSRRAAIAGSGLSRRIVEQQSTSYFITVNFTVDGVLT